MSATPRNSNKTRTEKLMDQFVDILVKITAPDPATGEAPNPGAPMTNVIRQFLKDQNIAADDDKHEGLQKLKQQSHTLPFAERPNDGDLS